MRLHRIMMAMLVAASPAAVVATAPECAGPVAACTRAAPGAVALLAPGRATLIAVDAAEDAGVRRAASDLVGDLVAVGGGTVRLVDKADAGTTVIAGTLGSPLIEALIRAGKIDVGGLAGQWEGYVEQVVERPLPGVDRALMIVGADRRGTIFGLYDISAKAGVSPWTWWADVPTQRHSTLYLTAGRVADHPVVKYRGIFINDEEPAFGGWVRARFGGVNHLAYEKLFTLLLRSKANFLWPAMWGKSLWQDDPASAPLAREMGVILGTSHHEPMERANIEWQRQGGGPWDYTRNADRLRAFWRAGIARRGVSEDPVTIGMRGDGDEPMTQGTAIGLLQRIITDQRRTIAEVTGKPAAATPQVWALYKEVQDYYDQGMRVPDDVTLLFSDDNWGNIRRLPAPGERRAGGGGVYYHFDYVGGPRNYKWLDTNAVPRVWQQMAMAHRFGADRLWIVNVGDLKPMEYATSFFLTMAWDPDRMTEAAMQAYPARWAAQQFGAAQGPAIGALIADYGRLASRRKPELIDADTYATTAGGWARVLGEWNALAARARRMVVTIPTERRDAYDELVLHRIEAMTNLHRLYAAVAANRSAARAGDAAATARWAAAARGYFAEDAALRRRYEGLAGGKWPKMMAQTHIGYTGWQQPDADVMPALATVAAPLPVPAMVAPPLRRIAADAGRTIDGAGLRWQRVAGFTAEGAAMIATPVTAPAIERPGGAGPQLAYTIDLPAGARRFDVVAAPGLDVRGTGRHRVALSLDRGAPVIVNLLAGETEARWGKAVADNRRVAGATLPVARSGRHVLHLWLVDPQVVIEGIEVAG
ncbi:glycosyl hydrolase 115 family protein [Sphingomonas sp. CD22]|uniref:glycosyl hydrolase 115 family protein n=1 Tax=Sphingomonas sp. CD22 TaxID=3100214 RepID=UPI002ADF1D67|nr:glycosyl hydrolase 115 family protein [Sphingomonas sp. CD22]MEA1085367.1 glycosyl hydrolase 115 family protein [Sphingomonas sp. CD22]